MDNKEYREYLKTTEWKNIAVQRMNIDKLTCQMCGSHGTNNNPLEVHHLTYKHLYHENEDNNVYTDLVTVCHNCHKSVHGMMKRVTDPEGREGWTNRNDIPSLYVYNLSDEMMSYERNK